MVGFSDPEMWRWPQAADDDAPQDRFGPVIAMKDLLARRPATVQGRIADVTTVEARHGPCFQALLADGTGSVLLVFLGRRSIPGLVLGTVVIARGTPRAESGRIEILNPLYELPPALNGPVRWDRQADRGSGT
ncbi:MAG: OB-fold nucleic acid binding domain-containing protein [Acidimicrobiales bacterium]